MNASLSAAPAAPARAAPADAAPAAPPRCTRAPRAASLAVSRPNAPLQATTTYFDLRVWPGYAAAVGLSEPPVIEDKRMYETMHFTKKQEAVEKTPKKRKKDKKDKQPVEEPNWKIPVKWRKAPTRGKVDHTPLKKRERKMAHKFAASYDLHRVKQRVLRLKQADKAAAARAAAIAATKAASVDLVPATQANTLAITTTTTPAITATTTTPPTITTTTALAMPGALPEHALVEAQMDVDDDASPSLTVALFSLAVEVVGVLTKRKRVDVEDEDESRNQKRPRVEMIAPSPSHTEDRPIAGKPARNAPTGATAPTQSISTATAAPSAAQIPVKPHATLSKCPPPMPMAPTFKSGQPPALPRESAAVVLSGAFTHTSPMAALRPPPPCPSRFTFRATTAFARESRAAQRSGTPAPRPSRSAVALKDSASSAPAASRAPGDEVDKEVEYDAWLAALVQRQKELPPEEVVKPDDERDVHYLLFESQRAVFLVPRWKEEEKTAEKKMSKTSRGTRGGRKSLKSDGKKNEVMANPHRDGEVDDAASASTSA